MLKKLGGAGPAYYMQKVEDRLNARYEAEIASGRMLPVKIDGTLMQSLATARTAAEIAATWQTAGALQGKSEGHGECGQLGRRTRASWR